MSTSNKLLTVCLGTLLSDPLSPRQFEGTYRTLQYKEWGEYETFYLMEADSVPVKSFWLDTLRREIGDKAPFAILGANFQLNSVENHRTFDPQPRINANKTTGNYIYNLSHPLLDAFVSQLEVEAPSPYNSIPYDDRLVQLLEEGRSGAVPEIAPKILLDEEGAIIEIANNTAALKKWVEEYTGPEEGWCQSNNIRYWISPYKETPELVSVLPSNVVREDLRDGSVIHAVRVYESWIEKREERPLTLVISSKDASRTEEVLASLDRKRHPFSKVRVMVDQSAVPNFFKHTEIPTTFQIRQEHWEYRENFDSSVMDMCQVDVATEWFVVMDTDLDIRDVSEIYVATPPGCGPGAHYDTYYESHYCHRSRIRTANDRRPPGPSPLEFWNAWRPVVPFRPATYEHVRQFRRQSKVLSRAKSFLRLAHKINATIGSSEAEYDYRIVYGWDAVYHSTYRDWFCNAWTQVYGEYGEHLEAEPWGPTATDYYSFLRTTGGLINQYRLTDSSIYLHKSPVELSTQDEEVRKLKLGEDIST